VQPIDLSKVRTIPLRSRSNKVERERFARPSQRGRSFVDFFASLPGILAGNDLRSVVEAIVAAHRAKRPVILGMGGHVIKCGLSPILIDLMERRIITTIAMNGSAAVHDCEIALIGETSEDVAAGLRDGTFGMVRETGDLMNRGLNRVLEEPTRGMGDLLGDELQRVDAPFRSYSVLAAGQTLGVPVTVHVAVGTDIHHMHPTANGAAIGQATFNDFRILSSAVSQLSGGVYLNVGSAVVMPEVFLKAFTIAQNLGAQLQDYVTVNMDMQAHYRPSENVVRRPASVAGRGYTLIGRHELLIPLIAQAVVESLDS
jgi:deoxyhypusine synthase